MRKHFKELPMPRLLINNVTAIGLRENFNKGITFTDQSGLAINDKPGDNPNPISGAIAVVDYDGESKDNDDVKNTDVVPVDPPDDMEPDNEPE